MRTLTPKGKSQTEVLQRSGGCWSASELRSRSVLSSRYLWLSLVLFTRLASTRKNVRTRGRCRLQTLSVTGCRAGTRRPTPPSKFSMHYRTAMVAYPGYLFSWQSGLELKEECIKTEKSSSGETVMSQINLENNMHSKSNLLPQ